jgi:hypothetical protein
VSLAASLSELSVDAKELLMAGASRPFFARPEYVDLMRCLGFVPGAAHLSVAEPWDDRIPVADMPQHPLMLPMHGGVSPARLVAQARLLALLLNVSHYAPSTAQSEVRDAVVELGCGNAALLCAMCPPTAALSCAGTDFATRPIKHAKMHMRHVDLRVAVGAPHIGTGAATAVFSHGVAPYLNEQQLCGHVAEGLRLLRAGGRLVLWMLHISHIGSRVHPSFFEEDGMRLQFCEGLAPLVEHVTVYRRLMTAVYPADFVLEGFYGIRIVRSTIAVNGSTTSSSSRSGSLLPMLHRVTLSDTKTWTTTVDMATAMRKTSKLFGRKRWVVGGEADAWETAALLELKRLQEAQT